MAKQTFTTGQVLTAAQMTSLQQTAMGGGSTTAKTVSYTLVAADAGTVVQMNSASATTITVNTALFAAGDTVQIQNIGAGVCTVTAGTATVNTAGSLALSQWEGGQLYFTATDASVFFDVVQTAATAKVLQLTSTQITSYVQIASTTMTDTNITASITPTSNTSQILVTITACIRTHTNTAANPSNSKFNIVRDATTLVNWLDGRFFQVLGDGFAQITVQYLDSPATTSATTYKAQGAVDSTADGRYVEFQLSSYPSTITLMEIGA
jgi:hypothetical protein